jgi:hypothetical protein
MDTERFHLCYFKASDQKEAIFSRVVTVVNNLSLLT